MTVEFLGYILLFSCGGKDLYHTRKPNSNVTITNNVML